MASERLLSKCPNLEDLRVSSMFKLEKAVRIGLANVVTRILEQCPTTLKSLDFSRFSLEDVKGYVEGKVILKALNEHPPTSTLDVFKLWCCDSWWTLEDNIDLLC